MRSVRVVVAAVLAAVLLPAALAGCTSGTEPRPNYSSVSASPSASTTTPPSPTASPSPSVPTTGPNVSPGESPPTEPDLASQHTQEGVMAFAAYYYRMSDWMFATSDVQILEPLFSSECTQCVQSQDNLRQLLGSSNHFEGGRITTNAVQLVSNDGRRGAEYAVTGTFAVTAASVMSADGQVVQSFGESSSFQLTDWMRWSSDHWLIVEERRV